MPKPLIGITTRNGKDADGHPLTALQHTYTKAIVQAGGLPILIPSMLAGGRLPRFVFARCRDSLHWRRGCLAGIFQRIRPPENW